MKLLTKIKKMVRDKYKDTIGCAWLRGRSECTIDGKKCRYLRDKIKKCEYFERTVLPQDKKLENKYYDKIEEIIDEQSNH